ncbi:MULTISPECIES: ribonuclease T2 [Halocynthiibacter]|uniref:Ribonuclease T2 n=1 Tax=Halocynthiibacter halioticoli TaxID=2986804 RepID=A0AAE3J154_9RHOB|nr:MULTISPECIES: ribonuclease T2 [Halocynthiibacter]MCV6823322.1 ribonuclease T2 [Halocynthiibacter halioticoli]MCW4056323.1 ribonuclease T2 [Halocynthiibacter sp. SDUM655004]
MRNLLILLLFGIIPAAHTAKADSNAAGEFHYYILSLSWSPNWCLREGDDRDSPQCEPRADEETKLGWILHGLWPQFEEGWPQYCQTAHRPPSRADTAKMADIMGTSGLAWYQWKKHGTCAGKPSDSYFSMAREAYDSINRPEVLRKLPRTVKLPARVVEEAFLEANPQLTSDMITITCKAGQIQEARICLTKTLEPRTCGMDVLRDCTQDDALMAPLR